MVSIYKKEVSSFFNSLIGYLAIALFLLVTGLVVWIFPDSSVLDSGYASLDGFFSIAPYLFIFLIPAIAMRAIAGEKSDGTFDLLQSRPNRLIDIVFGKYLGILTIAFLAILPTVVYAVSLYFLASPQGNIDVGATIGSYIGLFFLTTAYAAISIFCSSLTRNPVISFLLGIFATFIAYYGFEALGGIVNADYTDFIKNLGIQAHYDSLSRGVLTSTDAIYFVALSALFLLFTVGHTGRAFRPRKKTFTCYGIAIIIYFALHFICSRYIFGRLDFTEDKRFTLSKTSKELLSGINEDVHITLFLDGNNLPNGFNRLRQAAIDMANDLKTYAHGKLTFNLIDPLAGSQEEQQEFTQALIERGLFPTNLSVKTDQGFSQKLIFPNAIVNTKNQEVAVNLLQQKTGASAEEALNNSIQNLEYAFSSAIRKATQERGTFIGFTEGHNEPTDLELYDAMHSLMDYGQVGRVNLDSVNYESLNNIKLLFIVKPQTAFSESDKYKIDYFVRHGGRVIWAIDQIDASLEHLRKTGTQALIGRTLNIDDQLFLYGVRLNYNLLADLNCGQIPLTVGNVGNQSQIELAPWYFFPILMPTSANPMLKNLDGIRTEFIGTIDTIESPSIKKEILLSSSPFAKTIATPAPISLQMVEQTPDPQTFRTRPLPVAVLLQGSFPYIFENRPAPKGIQQPIDLSGISKPNKMIVINDGDWLINQINSKDQSPFPLGWDRYTEQQFANKTLLLNMADYLLNDETFIALRNREVKLRLLDQVKIKESKTVWQIINVALPLLILSLIALIQQTLRRKRYGKH